MKKTYFIFIWLCLNYLTAAAITIEKEHQSTAVNEPVKNEPLKCETGGGKRSTTPPPKKTK